LSKKELAADQPTWCPGCGDFSVLSLYFKLIEKRKMWHEKITTSRALAAPAASPISSRPWRAHYIHGGAAFASGISLSRQTCTCFVFGGERLTLFPSGENHFNHTARKNIKMTYVVMDNWGLWPDQEADFATSPLGLRARPMLPCSGLPINPMNRRSPPAQPSSPGRPIQSRAVMQMMEAAMDHDGFSFVGALASVSSFTKGPSMLPIHAKAGCSTSCLQP